MEKRRRHQECKPAECGCLVVEGTSCSGGNSIWLVAKSRFDIWRKRERNVFGLYGTYAPIFLSFSVPLALYFHGIVLWRFTHLCSY